MLYRLLTHTNRRLHKASCSASVAFRDAIVNCPSFSSINLSVLLPSSSYQTPAAPCHFPPVHQLLHFSSFIMSHLQPFLSIIHTTVITLLIYFPFCLWVIDMLTKYSKKAIKVKLGFSYLVWCKSCFISDVELQHILYFLTGLTLPPSYTTVYGIDISFPCFVKCPCLHFLMCFICFMQPIFCFSWLFALFPFVWRKSG